MVLKEDRLRTIVRDFEYERLVLKEVVYARAIEYGRVLVFLDTFPFYIKQLPYCSD
jgi:hypothetical protein